MSNQQSVIGKNHPRDGNRWECQCGRCGSSMFSEDCQHCGGEGVTDHDCGEDTCCCLYPEDNVPCDICGGEGAFLLCISSKEWCQAHPLNGRENVERHTPEWFRITDTRNKSIDDKNIHKSGSNIDAFLDRNPLAEFIEDE